jgi:hypothetical protein
MKADFETFSIKGLLQIVRNTSDDNRDLRFDAEIHLLQRWRDGIDLDPLIEMLESSVAKERLDGAYYLIEAVPRCENLIDAATALSIDPLPYCRKAFVGYVTNTGLYGKAIATGLAECLGDSIPIVRAETINWAVYTTDNHFANFSEMINAASDSRGHLSVLGTRALLLARRLREGQRVGDLEDGIAEEDAFIFSYLKIFETRLRRYAERRKSGITALKTAIPYDDFELGALGEVYDNLGMLKGRLSASSVPAHITDAQLEEASGRAKESMRHRTLDQSVLSNSRRE